MQDIGINRDKIGVVFGSEFRSEDARNSFALLWTFC